ncbi:hypothetical protein Taro_032564, partial [Colocasia esculenta]|nr:hypothetical protein [Colocasia esculenta]
SAGARGKAVVCVVAADRAGNGELECGVRGAFLGFRRDSRFFGGLIEFLRAILCVLAGFTVKILASTSVDAEFFTGRLTASLLSVVVWRLFRNASLVGYPRFFVSQARVFVVLGVLSRYNVSRFDPFEVCPSVGTVWYLVVVGVDVEVVWCDLPFVVFYLSWILTGLGYGFVLVFSTLDINSGLASRAILCVLAGSVVKILASTSVDAEFFTGRLTASVVVWRLFRNASLVGYPRFFVSQARVFVVLRVLSRYNVSRFDPFEVCPSVGTIWYLVVVGVEVEVVWCDLPFVVFYPSWGIMDQFLVYIPITLVLKVAREVTNLGRGMLVWSVA